MSAENGFFTDVTLCIGCKACEVACKQWNELPADGYAFSGNSYDNTERLSATTWRHVAFVEQMDRVDPAASRWMMMSDVCKHCTNAGCLEACPTGAIVRNEFGDVYVQPDVCNGCGYCVPSCPFGVVAVQPDAGVAQKCTLCYDRQKDGLEPACAKACPTDSIMFGPVEELRAKAEARVAKLRAEGARRTSTASTAARRATSGRWTRSSCSPTGPRCSTCRPSPCCRRRSSPRRTRRGCSARSRSPRSG